MACLLCLSLITVDIATFLSSPKVQVVESILLFRAHEDLERRGSTISLGLVTVHIVNRGDNCLFHDLPDVLCFRFIPMML